MEKFRKLSCSYNLVFFICFAVCLLDGKVIIAATRTKGTTIWSRNTHIDSSGFIYARNGSSLELNCSVDNQSVSDIGWTNNNRWLNAVVQQNQVVQLKIEVTWGLNGSTYWCGPRNESLINSVQGTKVIVIIGDLPSPARNAKRPYKIFGLDAFQIHVYWEAASYVGQLPTYYTVTYKPCYNDTFCGNASEFKFCSTPHLPGKVQYHCQRLRKDLLSAIMSVGIIRDLFNVTIATVNAIGERKAPSFWIDADYGGDESPFLPTPLPPKSFKVTAVGSDWIQMSWTRRTFRWKLYDHIKYTILYHSVTDHKNKTKIVQNEESVTLNDGIKPYSWYLIYITVELIDNNTHSGPSQLLGPVNVDTKQGTPLQGPSILRTTSNVYSNDTRKRNVTIEWEEPNKSSWQGKPSYIKVDYKNVDNQSLLVKKLLVTQNIPSTVTVTGLSSKDLYYSSITLCNTKHCGMMGPQTTIEPVYTEPESQRGATKWYNNGFLLGLGLSATGVVLIFIIVVTWMCYKRSHNRTNPSLESRCDEMTIYVDDIYEDVGNREVDNEYQKANINAL